MLIKTSTVNSMNDVRRCDGRNDCTDASDEVDCDKVVVPETYLNDVPVPPEEGEQLARIKLSVEVISILELSEVDAIMTLQYREERMNVCTWLREFFLLLLNFTSSPRLGFAKPYLLYLKQAQLQVDGLQGQVQEPQELRVPQHAGINRRGQNLASQGRFLQHQGHGEDQGFLYLRFILC